MAAVSPATPSAGGPSFWLGTTPATDYPPLAGDVSVDVAVLGGGITGLTAALLLKGAGRSVAVVESKRIVRGATGYTTAKVTSGHSLIYAELARKFGEEGARVYAQANEAALERIARFVDEHRIECDFERKANYVYAEQGGDVAQIEGEVEAARRAGLPASFATETTLPYPIAGAVRLENQAQFHPRKYLLAFAERVQGDGSYVFEETRALHVRERAESEVVTDRGVLRARDVVVATHLPFLDRGMFFAKAHPSRSYAIAAPIDASQAPDGMFINTGQPTRSIRTMRDGERLYLNVGGEGHKPGEAEDTPERYARLEEFLRRHWGAGPVEYRWSTQDYTTVDRVPYVGKLWPRSEHVYVATGYGKWGMTSGTLAAMILADAILGVANPWAELYRAERVKPRASARKLVSENVDAGRHFFGDRLRRGDKRSPSDLRKGEGAILDLAGAKRAVYRDEQGTLHALSPVCQHLYCIVAWNEAERTWDCPCHGSRYTGEGKAIQGPTTKDLPRRALPGEDY